MILAKLGQRLANLFGENTPLDSLNEKVSSFSELIEPHYLTDLLPYRLYDTQHRLYENKTSIGFILEMVPCLGTTDTTQSEISTLIKEIGEEDLSIQALLWADHRIQPFLEDWALLRKNKASIFQRISARKIEFFKEELLNGDIPPRIFRFFFSLSLPKPLEKDLPFFLEKLIEKRNKAIATFSRFTSVIELPPVALLETLSGMINFEYEPSVNSRKKWNEYTYLSKQLCLPGGGIEVRKNHLVFHGKEETLFKSFEAINYPDEWTLSYMHELIGDFFNSSYRIPSPFFLHYGIHFPSQEKEETRFKTKDKVLQHQSKFSTLLRMFPDMARTREENLFIKQQLLEGEKFVATRLSVGLWSKPDGFFKSESILLSLFQKYGFKLQENHFIHFPDLLASLPLTWGELSLHIRELKKTRTLRTTLTSETGGFLPMIGEWWGNSRRGMLLLGRRGQLVTWDPFAADGNLNAVVVGPSGSGKSVFMQDLILSELGQGGRVFVLDLGRSFEKLCLLLDGEYLFFTQSSNLNLNPFNLIKDNGNLENLNASLDMVSSIVATMAMPSQKIDKERADILSTLVKHVWQKKKNQATVDDIVSFLDDIRFKSELMVGATESLKEGLKKYGKDGPFTNYFYGSQPIAFKKDLVVIETEELKNMVDLQAVILQIFALTISNQVFMGSREKRCLICIDEAWDLLKSPQMEGFIESMARRLRKYNGSLIVGTQGLKDFERSHGARAAFQNSNWLLMLGKDNDSINILKKENLIPMDDFKERMLSSLRKEDEKYSEVFIYHKGTGFTTLNQLKLDPFSSLLYSTSAMDFQALQELRKLGLEVEEAIEWLLLHKKKVKDLLQWGSPVKEAISKLFQKEGLPIHNLSKTNKQPQFSQEEH